MVRHALHLVVARGRTAVGGGSPRRGRGIGCGHVVVTGGEPLLQREIGVLTSGLRTADLHVTVETAGTVDPDFECDLLSVSPKTANSDPQGGWRDRHRRLRTDPAPMRRLARAFPRPPAQVCRHRCRRSSGTPRSDRDNRRDRAIEGAAHGRRTHRRRGGGEGAHGRILVLGAWLSLHSATAPRPVRAWSRGVIVPMTGK